MKSEESILARMISKISEPQVMILVIALIGAWHARVRGISYTAYALYIVSIGLLVTAGRVRLMRVLRTNWDLSHRPKRVWGLLFLLLFSVLLYGTIWLWRSPDLTRLYGLFLVWIAGFLLITLRIKLSGHVGVFVLSVGLLARWYEFSLWVLVILVPLIGWSRVKMRRHTIPEVIIGALYSLLVLVWYNKLTV